MKNFINKVKDKSLVIYLIINLMYVLIGSYMTFNNYIDCKIFSYGYICLLILNIITILILIFKNKYIKNKIDIFLILIIILACISTIFAYDGNEALFGEWNRYEGLFVICYYITILFIASHINKDDKKIIVYSIIIFGLIQCIYACCQKFNLFNVNTIINKSGYRLATGFTSNINFFGTLMILCICYSIGLYIETENKLKILLFFIISFLFSIGILLSKARSCMLGLIIVMIILLIYSIKNKHLKKYIALIIAFAFSTFLMQFLNFTPIIDYYKVTTYEVKEISKGNLNDDFGTRRMKLWRETIKIVPKYLLHGVGIDNFCNVIDGRPIKSSKGYYDKAHNEYLQILVTMGIFSLLSYLSLHFLIIKNGIKNTFKNKKIYLLLPVIGYLVQAQFSISVIEVAPIFYISLGLLVDRGNV